jgi:general secretion pathway protein D
MPLERINSLLVADTTININRIKEVIGQLDQPIELKEKLRIFPIRHSKATDIKARLDEIIADQKDKDKQPTVRSLRQSGSPGVETTPTLPGVIRARLPTTPGATAQAAAAAEEEGQMIRGNVKVIADDRTGVLIIITRPENMPFLEQIVTALDIATSPDVSIKVVRLEYADSEEVATMLNALIGAAGTPGKTATPKTAAGTAATSTKSGEAAAEPARSSQLQDFIEQQRQAATSRNPEAKSKIGQLSAENIKILSDKRSNAIIIMASKGDMVSLLEILKDMDIMLSQVLIEAVILGVTLDDKVQSGVNWVQRSMIAYDKGSGGTREPIFSYAGGGGGDSSFGTVIPQPGDIGTPGYGLTYYFTHFGLNLDMLVRWAATDSRTRVLASPVILTSDNKEAIIDISSQQYVYKGISYQGIVGSSGQQAVPNVDLTKVGLNLTVTPRINQKKFVVMQINQKFDEFGTPQLIEGQGSWPTIDSREMSASIAVRSGETIILGGMIKNTKTRSRSKIPILGDLPLLGVFFRSSDSNDKREEVVVFITPRVLDTPEEIQEESERRKQATSGKDMWQQGGWSASTLAEPPPGRIRQWWRNLLK